MGDRVQELQQLRQELLDDMPGDDVPNDMEKLEELRQINAELERLMCRETGEHPQSKASKRRDRNTVYQCTHMSHTKPMCLCQQRPGHHCMTCPQPTYGQLFKCPNMEYLKLFPPHPHPPPPTPPQQGVPIWSISSCHHPDSEPQCGVSQAVPPVAGLSCGAGVVACLSQGAGVDAGLSQGAGVVAGLYI